MQYNLFNYDNPDLLSEEEKARLQFYVDLKKANSRNLEIEENFRYIFENKELAHVFVEYDEEKNIKIALHIAAQTGCGIIYSTFNEGEMLEENDSVYNAIYKIDTDILATLNYVQDEIFKTKCIFEFFKLVHSLIDIEKEVLDNDKMRKKVKREILKQKI